MFLFNAEDFLSLCLTYSNFINLIGELVARILLIFGITAPSLTPACRQIYDAITM